MPMYWYGGSSKKGTTIVQAPVVSVGTYTYNGNAQGPTITIAEGMSEYIDITNATKVQPGTYTLTLSLKNAATMVWNDLTTAPKTYSYTIGKIKITEPTVTIGTYTYNGNAQGPTISSTANLTVTNGTKTEPGTYTLSLAITDGDHYIWADGTTAAKTYQYTINKITGSITVPSTTINLTTASLYSDVAVTYNGDGALSASSANSNVASVALQSGTTYRITAQANGSTTVTFSAPATSHYTAASKTVTVNCTLVDSTLENNSWETISAISAAGTASTYWNVGDCKKVTLNGTVGTLSLSNKDLYVFILGFNHNSSVEGSGISFGCFKSSQTSGVDLCLVDDTYGSSGGNSGSKKFALNHWGTTSGNYNTNYGGWKGCDARYDILGSTKQEPSGYGSTPTTSRVGYDAASDTATSPVANTLMASLPSALRAVMKPITKYTDNKGNASNVAANVTPSVDYLPLLSEFEVQGARSYANEYEKNSQKQYQYYINGNSKIKKKHSATSDAARWWTRSPAFSSAYGSVNTDGSASYYGSRFSIGLAPAFLV